ncbi:Luc7-like protein [Tetrabaena socialis]|uniref:Luc7-like protein n=1 Tax=Tetrabaena socialis TaxID=47790 RepID=A0A2J8AFF8_9CHLO|nr:Luc7-like protein [Tetrabaena socialis]|eukprot:PNH11244.1 Luc7-like protein [Tetrabaena socialis]
MVDAMRAMLDELMGKERNVPLGQRSNRRLRFDDPSVCKYALAGLCPNGLFKNTRSDLGHCPYELHEDHIEWDKLKEEYDRQDAREHERYERRLMKVLEDLIREMDRKIGKAKDRAEAESSARPLKPEDAGRLAEMQAKSKELLHKSQEAGEAGDVDVSMALAQQAQEMQAQHDRLHRSLTAPERTMSVCDICGVFINSTDNDQRRQEHLTGKQYLGWKAIREKFAELQNKWERSRSRDPDMRETSAPLVAPEERPQRSRERERERERSPPRREFDARGDSRGRGAPDGRGRGGDDGAGYERGAYERGGGHDRGGGYERGRGYDNSHREYDTRRDDWGQERGVHDSRARVGGQEDREYDGGGRTQERRDGYDRRGDGGSRSGPQRSHEERRRY